MQLPNRQQLAVALMVFSLGLLTLFLGLFVRKLYTDELETLKRESSLLFVGSLRGIEGELFDKLIVRSSQVQEEDVEANLDMRLPALPQRDSMQVFTYIQKRRTDGPLIRRDSQLHIQLTEGQPLTGNPNLRGALSVIVAMNDQRLSNDSLGTTTPDTARIFRLLQHNFSEAMLGAGLPVHFRLLHLHRDSLQAREFIAGSYTDLASGEGYGAALSDYRPYLLRRLLPQLLFALLLFACVTLAFLFIFQTLRRQQRLAEQKNGFVANMTHELKTPIATVQVAVEALQNFEALQDRARTTEYLQIARQELDRLSLLVEKVLRLSLFEKNGQSFQLETPDLKTLVEKVLQSMQLQLEQVGAELEFSSTDSDFRVRGDRLHLSGVVYNLVDNALKYSPLNPKIGVHISQRDGKVTLLVSDRGQGIPAPYHHKIFERFFRVPSGNVHTVKGHGLGLSYVAEVLQQHGGQVQVSSVVGAGSTFTITLPQA